ncbi:MAG: 23S rRNA (pseudouridine(1915)-N(3))-methyltransferase RlmH [Flavobacteriales bacterium]|nr:23S rRNA (pseudouridine(1915)-N(3))-methyltransferase RlmH [Flavobacteriales bacterium]
MKIRLLLVGRTERGHVSAGMDEYVERCKRMTPFEPVVLAEERVGQPAHRQRAEGERILEALKPGERLVALDERGKSMTSEGFAQRIGTWRDGGTRQLAFVVGGAYGLSEEVRERADLILSLSAMTFPHQLVRVLFAEQLYRALTILNRLPYHH